MLLGLVGCSAFQSEIEDLYTQVSDIQKTESEIKQQIDEINTSITVLNKIVSTLQAGGYVKSFVPYKDETGTEVGYIITLSNGDTVTIHNGKDGKDGVMPAISAKRAEDGLYYWTLDGEYLIGADGEKVRADGVTPTFEIRDDCWYISYDNGTTWTNIGTAIGQSGEDGKAGDQLFSEIEYQTGSNVVVFHMSDGSQIVLPCYQAISISFDIQDNLTAIAAGETIKVGYTLSYGDKNTVVTVSSDGNYKATVVRDTDVSGSILITCPGLYQDGHIIVMAFDGVGYASIAIINFYEKKIVISGGTTFWLPTEGGDISATILYNSDYFAEVDKDCTSWIQLTRTKSEDYSSGTLQAHVTKNDGDERVGYIYLYTSNTTGVPYLTLEIHQSAAYFSLDPTSFVFSYDGGTAVSHCYTSRGVTLKPSADWIETSVTTVTEDQNYDINIKVGAYNSTRTGTIGVWSGDGKSLLGTIEIMQVSQGEGEQLYTIFRARANIANNYTVYLPIDRNSGTLECVVDWGDGTKEMLRNGTSDVQGSCVYHKYSGITESGKEFDISISGTMTRLCSDGIPGGYRSGIIAVKQWGNTGLNEMYHAFYEFTSLESLPADEYRAFANVYSFSEAFAHCPRLTTVDKNLFQYASNATNFYGLFRECSALETIPQGLFLNCKNATSFSWAFYRCLALTEVPSNVFKGCVNLTNLSYTFYNCQNLEKISDSAFAGCGNVNNCNEVFSNCTSLKAIPAGLFKDCVKAKYMSGIFSNCNALESIPAGLFKYNTLVEEMNYAFQSCYNLKKIPEGLFDNCPEIYTFESTFNCCSSLVAVPTDIFDNQVKVKNFQYTFGWTHQLQGESPYSMVNGKKVHLYERKDYPDYFVTPIYTSYCFAESRNLSDYENIPSSWTQDR